MANHASHAALPYPVKGARFTVLIPYWNSSGVPTDPVTPDTEVSKDDGAAADTTEEVSSPKNSVGMLTLTGAETDCSCLSLAAKAASGSNTTLQVYYPKVLAAIWSGTATAGAAGSITLPTSVPRSLAKLIVGCIIKTTGGTGGGGTGGANNQARVCTGFTTGGVASVVPDWEVTPDNTTTFEVLLTPEAQAAWLGLVPIEPAAVPSWTSVFADWFGWLFAKSRNKSTQTATAQVLRNDADNANIGSASVADDGTTFTRGEWS